MHKTSNYLPLQRGNETAFTFAKISLVLIGTLRERVAPLFLLANFGKRGLICL